MSANDVARLCHNSENSICLDMGERRRNWIEMNRQRSHEIEDDMEELGGGCGGMTKVCKRKRKEHKIIREDWDANKDVFIYLFKEKGKGCFKTPVTWKSWKCNRKNADSRSPARGWQRAVVHLLRGVTGEIFHRVRPLKGSPHGMINYVALILIIKACNIKFCPPGGLWIPSDCRKWQVLNVTFTQGFTFFFLIINYFSKYVIFQIVQS